MNKKLKFIIAGVAIMAGLASAVSCKDYGSDIANLTDQVNSLSSKVSALEGEIKAGAVITAVKTFNDGNGGIEIVLSNGQSYKIYNGTNGKDGAAGTSAAVWEIKDGYWYKDGVKTEYKAVGTDGKNGTNGTNGTNGKNGNYWQYESGWLVEYDGTTNQPTGKKAEIIPGGGGSTGGGITAVWDGINLIISGLTDEKGTPLGDVTIACLTPLKGLAFVPERIFDGLGLITVYEFTAPKNNTAFPFVNPTGEAQFIATSATEVTYRMDAATVDVDKYDWDFINRIVYTKAAGPDKTDLVTIEEGPVKNGSFVNFKIKLNKSVKPAAHAQNNDIVALRAIDENKEPVVSDYAYIEKETNTGYALIHKDGYKKGDPRYYRVKADDVEIGDPGEYNYYDYSVIPPVAKTNAPLGLEVDEDGVLVGDGDSGLTKNPTSPVLVLNKQEEIDLLDYVETYAKQLKDLVSTKGVIPTYTFQFAGFDATDKIIINSDSNKATYLSDDTDKTNQNDFVILEGSKVKINRDKYTTGNPAVGRTPLIYVQSTYNGIILAEGFIKIEIVADAPVVPPTEKKGYKVFIKHAAEFEYDNLPTTPAYKGAAFTAPLVDLNKYDQPYNTAKKHELNVDWEEMNVKVFDALGMSFEEFTEAYDAKNPILIVKDALNNEPGDLPDEGKYEFSADMGELNTIYNPTTLSGLTIYKLSPENWKQNTNIVHLDLDETIQIDKENVRGPHYVYIVYKAKDNTQNVDAVVKFVYNVKHVHEYTIYTWLLNPDYILGNQDELNPEDPVDYYNKPAAPYNKDDKGWGAVRIKGQDPGQPNPMRSGLTEHFLEYMLDFKVNKESTYRFTIKNFTDDEVNWEDNGLGTVGTDPVTKHAYVEFTGTEMQTIVDDPAAQSAYIPYIYLVKTTLISKGYDVLIEVTETCTPLNESKKAYYYVVFKALDLKLNLYNVKLGTFKEYNDFALAHELVKNIEDINGNEIFKWETDKWVATDAAKVYGITDAAKLTIEVTKLIFDYDTEESFGDNLYVFKSGTTLDPTGYTTTETGINWWNLGTDLQKDKKAKFFVDLKWDGESLTDNTGEVVVLATANSIHPLHEADGTVKTPVAYKDGWFYATK